MNYIGKFGFLLGVVIFVIGCSTITDMVDEFIPNDDEDTEQSVAAEEDNTDAETEATEDDEDVDIDLDELAESTEYSTDEDSEIPDAIPSDVPLPDDMVIEVTLDSGIMSQVMFDTQLSFEELQEMYEDYLNSSSQFSGSFELVEPGFPGDSSAITYSIDYGDVVFYVQIHNSEEARTVSLSVM